ncbi:glycosyltransferase family A protein [soil metagenome]
MITGGTVRSIGVVIPARDEESLIGRCLASVSAAAREVAVPVSVVVVADGCLDSTATVAREFRGVDVVEIESSNVGTARATGARRALALGADWLANTDADSVVPSNWIAAQLDAAAAGADVLVGTVRPDFADLSAERVIAWLETHADGSAIGNVHGANLGVRSSAYRAVGGYLSLPEHEDVDLVRRLSVRGTVLAHADAEVMTSGRLVGRTPGGYAGFLRDQLRENAFAAQEAGTG